MQKFLPFSPHLSHGARNICRAFETMVELVPLHQVEASAVEALLDAAFGADRFNRTAYKLRAGVGVVQELSFAACDGGELVGSIQCWPVVHVSPRAIKRPLTLVGPVAVSPALQRGGIGRMLMARMLQAAETHGHGAMMMIGDPEYYERFFGFSAALTQGWELPGPFEARRLLARIDRDGPFWGVGTIAPDPAFASEAINA